MLLLPPPLPPNFFSRSLSIPVDVLPRLRPDALQSKMQLLLFLLGFAAEVACLFLDDRLCLTRFGTSSLLCLGSIIGVLKNSSYLCPVVVQALRKWLRDSSRSLLGDGGIMMVRNNKNDSSSERGWILISLNRMRNYVFIFVICWGGTMHILAFKRLKPFSVSQDFESQMSRVFSGIFQSLQCLTCCDAS